MSLSILPESLRPGTDLMSKVVVRNSKIFNIITTTLTNSQDEYIVGESEWNDGTRSDLVLEPKTPDLLPIVVEFQHTVNIPFLKRAINYCLEAFKRYQKDPILLIICIDTLSDNVYEQTKPSRVPGCRTFPSQVWASKCLILCQSSLSNCNTLLPLDPFVALGLFLTQQASSIINAPCNEDPTMKFLHTLAMQHYGSLGNQQHLIEVLGQLCDTQNSEYGRLLELIDNYASPKILNQAIRNAQSRNHELKRKYNEIDDVDSITSMTSSNTTTATYPNASTSTVEAEAFVERSHKF